MFLGTEISLAEAAKNKNIVGFMPVYDDSVRAAEDFPDAKFIKVERSGKEDGSISEKTA